MALFGSGAGIFQATELGRVREKNRCGEQLCGGGADKVLGPPAEAPRRHGGEGGFHGATEVAAVLNELFVGAADLRGDKKPGPCARSSSFIARCCTWSGPSSRGSTGPIGRLRCRQCCRVRPTVDNANKRAEAQAREFPAKKRAAVATARLPTVTW
jgi:hypothetical protein